MLKPAQLYKDELNKKMVEGWYDIENAYYHATPASYMIDVPDNNKETHMFVSVDKEDNIIGYISYQVDWEVMSADNFGVISFDKGNLLFIRDIYQAIMNLFNVYRFNRIAWFCYTDNPAIKGYRKFVRKLNGREIGIFRQTAKLMDGKIHDYVCFEILRSDFMEG